MAGMTSKPTPISSSTSTTTGGGTRKSTMNPNPPSRSTRPTNLSLTSTGSVSSTASVNAQHQDLRDRIVQQREDLKNITGERDIYYEKLLLVDQFCQEKLRENGSEEMVATLNNILHILYRSGNGEQQREDGTTAEELQAQAQQSTQQIESTQYERPFTLDEISESLGVHVEGHHLNSAFDNESGRDTDQQPLQHQQHQQRQQHQQQEVYNQRYEDEQSHHQFTHNNQNQGPMKTTDLFMDP